MPKGSGKPIPQVKVNLDMSPQQGEELLETLQTRFEENMARHEGLEWSAVQARLIANPEKLSSLYAMETTAGEPDVVGVDKKSGEFIFYDCSEQSPDRRSICYDGAGQAEREKKGLIPGGNAVDLAAAMGIVAADGPDPFLRADHFQADGHGKRTSLSMFLRILHGSHTKKAGLLLFTW